MSIKVNFKINISFNKVCNFVWQGNQIFIFSVTSWLGIAMVSVIRCVGIWTNNTCFILRYTKTLICMTWVIPILSISHTLYGNWGSDEHIRTGFVCWYFCGIKHMLHVSQYDPDKGSIIFSLSIHSLGTPFVFLGNYSTSLPQVLNRHKYWETLPHVNLQHV